MNAKRGLSSKLDRAQLFTVIEIAFLALGFAGTLLLQAAWPALAGLLLCWLFSRFVSDPLTSDIEEEVQSDWNDD